MSIYNPFLKHNTAYRIWAMLIRSHNNMHLFYAAGLPDALKGQSKTSFTQDAQTHLKASSSRTVDELKVCSVSEHLIKAADVTPLPRTTKAISAVFQET